MPDPFPRSTVWPWLRERLFPRGTNLIQWASYVVLIILLVIYAIEPPAPVSPAAYNSTLLVLAVLLVINIVLDDLRGLFANEVTGALVVLSVSAALAFTAIIVGRMFIGIYLLFMIIAQANAMIPSRPAILFSILLAGGYLTFFALSGSSWDEMATVTIGMVISLTFVITLCQVLNRYIEQSRAMKRLLEQLQQANAELLEARQKEKELTIAEERVRMARDLHDGLGHHLTALSIQLQAAEKLVKANPQTASEAIHYARDEVQAALKEVRQSVAVLREAPVDIQNLPDAIARLVEETGQRTGLRASFTQEGTAAELSPVAAMTLYRAAQEGLTNVQKHAGGAQEVDARLIYTANGVRLAIEDDGKVPANCAENSGGFGLAGLRERAHLLGGQLNCGPRLKGGFQVEICLPLATEAE